MNLGRCKSQPANVPVLPLNNVMRNCLANQAGSKNTIKKTGWHGHKFILKSSPLLFRSYTHVVLYFVKRLRKIMSIIFYSVGPSCTPPNFSNWQTTFRKFVFQLCLQIGQTGVNLTETECPTSSFIDQRIVIFPAHWNRNRFAE